MVAFLPQEDVGMRRFRMPRFTAVGASTITDTMSLLWFHISNIAVESSIIYFNIPQNYVGNYSGLYILCSCEALLQ